MTILTEKGVEFNNITLISTVAQHYSDESILAERKNSMDACGFIMKCENEKTLYLMGDTVWFDGLKTPLNQFISSREALRKFALESSFSDRLTIPEDGETVEL